MKRIKDFLIVFLVLSLIISSGCGNQTSESSEDFDAIVNSTKEIKGVSPELVNGILKSIPSPIEMSSFIHESGAPMQAEALNDVSNNDGYISIYKKAINLGIYSTDLGYLNIYGKTVQSISYLDAIKTIADNLRVGQFFDFNTIKRLASNNQNVDSLLYLSTSSFDKMNNYLSEQDRSHISALILIGGFIESLYLYCITYNTNPTDIIKDRICEQKFTLNDIMALLQAYQNNEQFSQVTKDLTEIKDLYKKVTITYTIGEPITVIVDGILMTEDNTQSIIEVKNGDFDKIMSKAIEVRNKVISIE